MYDDDDGDERGDKNEDVEEGSDRDANTEGDVDFGHHMEN